MIGLPIVLTLACRFFGFDFHAAYRIFCHDQAPCRTNIFGFPMIQDVFHREPIEPRTEFDPRAHVVEGQGTIVARAEHRVIWEVRHQPEPQIIGEGQPLDCHVIDRCNLTILKSSGFENLPECLANRRVEIVASLPCYLADSVYAQRGNGVFEKSIAALRRLNALGYGQPSATSSSQRRRV